MDSQEQQNQERIKSLLIEQLKKTPIIQVACEKMNIGRSTFYRWKEQDKEFSKAVDESVAEGTDFVSDLAESRLVEAIRDRNLRAVLFWLRSHSTRYATKIELNGKLRVENEPLTDDQKALIEKALTLSGLIHQDNKENL
ncbi:MAG: phBC6A51 family helix-turn-helix protein [Patescibacteria group bacterium]